MILNGEIKDNYGWWRHSSQAQKAEENDKKSKSSWGQPEHVEGLALESSWSYQLLYGMDMFCFSSHQSKLILSKGYWSSSCMTLKHFLINMCTYQVANPSKLCLNSLKCMLWQTPTHNSWLFKLVFGRSIIFHPNNDRTKLSCPDANHQYMPTSIQALINF